jgi:hypothetical protein
MSKIAPCGNQNVYKCKNDAFLVRSNSRRAACSHPFASRLFGDTLRFVSVLLSFCGHLVLSPTTPGSAQEVLARDELRRASPSPQDPGWSRNLQLPRAPVVNNRIKKYFTQFLELLIGAGVLFCHTN